MKSKTGKKADAECEFVCQNEHDVILATSGLFGTGMDIEYLTCVLELLPFMDETRALQDSGRFRPPKGGWKSDTPRKLLIHIVDCFDAFHTKWWNELKRVYKEKQYTLKDAEEIKSLDFDDAMANSYSHLLPL
jgi:hypothetical protein